MTNTPLRYPGGKSIMTSFFQELIKSNLLNNVTYCEPYAGGAGAAINLLLNNSVDAIHINDASEAIYSFWNALVTEGERFLQRVQEVEVNLEEWQRQRVIFRTTKAPCFDLGFATFFLSRTNRSGILSAGPIGGQDEAAQRKANYKIDCRFNKIDLLKRLNKIVDNRDRITISNLDALEFLRNIQYHNPFVYLDPPYYKQGKALYLNYYQHDDHAILAHFLKYSSNFKWVLSYDNVPEILQLYADFPLYQFELSYTAQKAKKGSELLTHSAGISFQDLTTIKQWNRKKEAISLFQITGSDWELQVSNH